MLSLQIGRSLTIITVAISSQVTLAAVDLKSLFEAASLKNETIQIQEQEVKKAVELRRQAWGGMMPKLTLSTTLLKQDIDTSSNSSFSSFREAEQFTAKINVSQPLFQGTAEYAALRLTEKQLEQSQLALLAEQLDLYDQVASVFYQALAQEKEIDVLQRLDKTLKERVKELAGRVKIGRSRRSELLSAKAQLALNESALETAVASRTSLVNELEQLTLLEIDHLSQAAEIPPLEELSHYTKKVVHHPKIVVAQSQVGIARESVNIEQAGHYPRLSLDGNYYFERPGILRDSEWDVGLILSIPLFQGGVVSSEVRRAKAEVHSQNLMASQLQRQLKTRVENRYIEAQTVAKTLATLKQALELSRQSYRLIMDEYRSGIIPYLEAIQAEREYWETLRRYEVLSVNVKWAWVQLMIAAGEMP